MFRSILKIIMITSAVATITSLGLWLRSYWYADSVGFVDSRGEGIIFVDTGRFIERFQPELLPNASGFRIRRWTVGEKARGVVLPMRCRQFSISRTHMFSSMGYDSEWLAFPLWWAPAASGLFSLLIILIFTAFSRLRRRTSGFEVAFQSGGAPMDSFVQGREGGK